MHKKLWENEVGIILSFSGIVLVHLTLYHTIPTFNDPKKEAF